MSASHSSDESRKQRRACPPMAGCQSPAPCEQTLLLTPKNGLAFWIALNATPVLTEVQRRLGAMMRGEL